MWNDIEYIIYIIKNSNNKTEVLNKLGLKNNGGNYNTLTTFIIKNNVNIDHLNKRPKGEYCNIKNLEDILNNNVIYPKTSRLKERLYRGGLKERKCELCGQGEEWNGNHMSLILDHINGDRYDNRLENLRIVCPNCNATLETHCRGLRKIKKHLCECGNKKKQTSKMCKKCYDLLRANKLKDKLNYNKLDKINRRKVERPPYTQLLLEISEFGYVKTGKLYGVSDNSIRKWIKMYEKHGEIF